MSEDIQNVIKCRYKVIEKIGSGAYGHVFKVIQRSTKKIKALKKNFDAFHNSSDAQRTYRQIMFLMQLKHPNIIVLDEVIPGQNGSDIYLVFEFMQIDLHSLIRRKILEQKHKKYILYQIAKAMLFIHSAGVLHRDIKPSNILVNEACDVKICDFGLVRSISQIKHKNQDILTQYIATRWYRAPEVMLGSRLYSTAIDVWSFGCVAAQIVKGKTMFPGSSTINQLQKIIAWTGCPSQHQLNNISQHIPKQIWQKIFRFPKKPHQEFFQYIDPDCLDLIKNCLQFNPENRYSFEQIIRHPYLSQYYDKSQIIRSSKKIKISVDDNRRLGLRDYKCLIQQFAKYRAEHTSNFALNINYIKFGQPSLNKYRIRQARKSIKTEQEPQKQKNVQNKNITCQVNSSVPQTQMLRNSQSQVQSQTVEFKPDKKIANQSLIFQRSQSFHQKRMKNLKQFNNVKLITISKNIDGSLLINNQKRQQVKQAKFGTNNNLIKVKHIKNHSYIQKSGQERKNSISKLKQQGLSRKQSEAKPKRSHTQQTRKITLGVYPRH